MADSFSFVALANELTNAKEEGLTFEDKQLKWDTAESVKDVVEALTNAPVVHYLKLEGNTLGTDAAAAIGKALEKHPEFRKAFWKNMFTGRLKNEIPVALGHLGNGLTLAGAQLTVLDLSDNALGPNGMKGGLETLIRSRVCYTLQELYLNNCGLGIGGGKMLSAAILDCHQASTAAGTPLKLKVFVAGRNRLENEGAKAIAKIFSTLKTLEEIAMPQNSIYHAGIAALASGMKKNPNLRSLNLNDNTVTHVGAGHLADAFEALQNLQSLNLGDCLLKTNGAYVIAEALTLGHLQLEEIDLGYNEINIDGCMALLSAMGNKQQLKIINLDANSVGPESYNLLLEERERLPNPSAFVEFEEILSDADNEDEDEDCDAEDDSDDSDGSTEEECDEEGDDHDDVYEYTDDAEEEDDDEAYVTTTAYPTKQSDSPNDSTLLSKSFVSAAADSTTVSAESQSVETCNASARDFCLATEPMDLKSFNEIGGEDKFKALMDCINQLKGNEHLLLLVFTALKCAHLSKESEEALKVAKELFKETFKYAVETKEELRIAKYLLIQLEKFDSGDKDFKPVYNVQNCCYAVNEFLNGDDVPSDYMRKILKTLGV